MIINMANAELQLHRTIPLKGLNPNLYRYNKINCLAISEDWSLIVTGSEDGEARLWKASTGNLVKICLSHTPYRVTSVAISPNIRFMASAGDGGIVRVWDIVNYSDLFNINIPDDSETIGCSVFGLGFSPDGSLLATAGSGGNIVRLWESGSWQLRHTLHGHRSLVLNAIFSPDGQKLATNSADSTIKIWDIMQGREIATLEGHKQPQPVTAIAFSNDGKHLVSGGADDLIKIWDLDKMREITTMIGHKVTVGEIAFLHSDSLIVACRTDGKLELWDAVMYKILHSAQTRPYCVPSIANSCDGLSFILGYGEGTVEQWRVAII